MTDKIGENEIIATRKYLIPDSEIAHIEFNSGAWEIKLEIEMHPNAEKQAIRIIPESDHAVIHFDKWDNAFGSVTLSPVNLGTREDGKVLCFMATNYKMGAINSLEIQFMIGDAQ